MNETLNIAEICPATRALGPGKRFVIWVQGCPFNCQGCIAPDWIPIKEANIIGIRELAERAASAPDLEGITISGGEPMLQADGLARLLTEVRAIRPGFSAIAYSGFTLRQLQERATIESGIDALLTQLDVLIDGLFVEQLDDGQGLRGSLNQRVHFLTNRYEHLREEFEHGIRRIEFHLLTGEVLTVGLPQPETLATLHSIVARLQSTTSTRQHPAAENLNER